MKKSHFLYVPDHVKLDRNIRYLLARNFSLDNAPMPSTDYIIVAGGDGTALRVIRKYRDLFNPEKGKPIFFGLNYGTKGFLLNQPTVSVIQELMRGDFEIVEVFLLQAEMEFEGGRKEIEYACNDFYFRSPEPPAKLRVAINGEVRRTRLVGDGIIVCTALGSTAYNASCHGPILPYEYNDMMILNAIAPSPMANWKPVTLTKRDEIIVETLETHLYPVNFYADGRDQKYEGVKRATIRMSDKKVRLAFAKSETLRQKQLRFQLPDAFEE